MVFYGKLKTSGERIKPGMFGINLKLKSESGRLKTCWKMVEPGKCLKL